MGFARSVSLHVYIRYVGRYEILSNERTPLGMSFFLISETIFPWIFLGRFCTQTYYKDLHQRIAPFCHLHHGYTYMQDFLIEPHLREFGYTTMMRKLQYKRSSKSHFVSLRLWPNRRRRSIQHGNTVFGHNHSGGSGRGRRSDQEKTDDHLPRLECSSHSTRCSTRGDFVVCNGPATDRRIAEAGR